VKNDLNNYGIRNPDGLIRDRFGENRARFENDGARFVRETPLEKQNEVVKQTEDFHPESTRVEHASSAPNTASLSELQSAAEPSLAASSTATASTATSAASASATAAATGTASGAAAAGAATVAATATSGAVAVAGTVAATVATAVIVVAVFVSTLAINLSLLLAGMTSLIFRVEMTGAQDEDFETPIYAIITDGEEFYDEQEVFRDTLLLTFSNLEPGTEYTVTVRNEEKIFFEKNYVTATSEVERGYLSAWNEGNEIFVIVEGVVLLDNERFTVTARDERGNVVFARDGVDEFAEYVFRFDDRHNFYFTLLVGGKMAAATELRLLDEPWEDESQYDFGAAEWNWSDDYLFASVAFPSFDGGDPLVLSAEVEEQVWTEPDCETDRVILYVARAYYEDMEFSDERTEVEPGTALEHDYAEPIFEWVEAEDGEGVRPVVTAVCLNNPEHVLEIPSTVESEVIEATCEENGGIRYVGRAEWNGKEITEDCVFEDPGTALGHDWGEPEYDWQTDQDGSYIGATAIFTCSRGHTIELEMTVETEEVGATCEVDGCVVWVATVELDGEIYSDDRSLPLFGTALGHDYTDAVADFSWEYDDLTGAAVSAVATVHCTRAECGHSEVLDAEEITMEALTGDVCEGSGEATYYARLLWRDVEYEGETTVTVTNIGHDWGGPEWEWTLNQDGWYSEDGAIMVYVCSHDPEHRIEVPATVEEDRSKYVEPTCEEPGVSTYVATAEYENVTHRDEQEVVWSDSVRGHDFGDLSENEPGEECFSIQKNENGEVTAATMTLHCARCDRDVTMDVAEIRVSPLDGDDICIDGGMAQYYLLWSENGLEYAKYVESEVGPLGHDYAEYYFNWDENDGVVTGATLYLYCAHDSEHFEEVEAVLTSVEHEETCEDDAYVVYTATAEYDGKTYTDERTVTDYGTAPGHDYPDPYLDEEQEGLVYNFRKNERGEITGATVSMTCARCGNTVTYEADEIELETDGEVNVCEDGGEAEYRLFWSNEDLPEFVKLVPVTLEPIDHDYGEPEFDWTSDGEGGYSGVSATFVCSRNEDHVNMVPAELTQEYIAATCETGAYTRYTATVIFGGVPYVDEKTVDDPENPATEHDYPDPNDGEEGNEAEGVSVVYRYDETGAIVGATLTLTCSKCGETVSYEADVIELQSPEPDLCNGETVEYYVYWDEFELERYKETTLAPLGHDYSSYEFEWFEDGNGGYAANLILTCSRNPDHVDTVKATVTETTGASGTTYHAEAEYGGEIYEEDYPDPTGTGG